MNDGSGALGHACFEESRAVAGLNYGTVAAPPLFSTLVATWRGGEDAAAAAAKSALAGRSALPAAAPVALNASRDSAVHAVRAVGLFLALGLGLAAQSQAQTSAFVKCEEMDAIVKNACPDRDSCETTWAFSHFFGGWMTRETWTKGGATWTSVTLSTGGVRRRSCQVTFTKVEAGQPPVPTAVKEGVMSPAEYCRFAPAGDPYCAWLRNLAAQAIKNSLQGTHEAWVNSVIEAMRFSLLPKLIWQSYSAAKGTYLFSSDPFEGADEYALAGSPIGVTDNPRNLVSPAPLYRCSRASGLAGVSHFLSTDEGCEAAAAAPAPTRSGLWLAPQPTPAGQLPVQPKNEGLLGYLSAVPADGSTQLVPVYRCTGTPIVPVQTVAGEVHLPKLQSPVTTNPDECAFKGLRVDRVLGYTVAP